MRNTTQAEVPSGSDRRAPIANPTAAQKAWPSLDGLRGVFMVGVFLFHVSARRLAPGAVAGIDMFFVLSGFLITTLLIREWRLRDEISLGQFYIRRALRLLPALVVALVGTVVMVTIFLPDLRGKTVASAAAALFYVANFRAAANPNSMGPLIHTWSLSVEEQFYALWPPALYLLLRVRKLARPEWLLGIAVGASVLLTVWRWYAAHHGASPSELSYRPDLQGGGLLLGCGLGIIVGFGRAPASAAARWCIQAASVAGCAFLLLFVLDPSVITSRSVALAIPANWAAAAAVIFAEVTFPLPVLTSLLSVRPIRWLGRLSYGFYLIHVPIIVLVNDKHPHWSLGARIAVTFALSVLGTALLRRFVEQRFLDMKTRFSRVGTKGPPAQPASAGGRHDEGTRSA